MVDNIFPHWMLPAYFSIMPKLSEVLCIDKYQHKSYVNDEFFLSVKIIPVRGVEILFMKKRVSLVATALCVLLPLAGCATSTAVEKPQGKAIEKAATAADTVRGFYERYFAAFAQDVATPDIAMSKAFKAEIQKSAQACKGYDDELCGWGADANPYLNSQDYDDGLSYTNSGISLKETASNTVRVDLNVTPSVPNGSKTTIVFNMVQENGQWVADDILYPDGKSLYSTRKGLADERASLSKISKAERIQFAKGASSATVTGKLADFDSVQYYVIGVGKGQAMTVEQIDSKSGGKVSIYITDPKGENANDMDLSCHSKAKVKLTIAGDYKIQVVECKKADPWQGRYSLKVTVK